MVQGTKMDDVSALSQAILSTAVLRQKYEDMTVPPECLATQLAVIIALSNGSDLLSLQLALLVDPNKDNAKSYTDAITRQIDRFKSSAKNITDTLSGAAATPAATEAASS